MHDAWATIAKQQQNSLNPLRRLVQGVLKSIEKWNKKPYRSLNEGVYFCMKKYCCLNQYLVVRQGTLGHRFQVSYIFCGPVHSRTTNDTFYFPTTTGNPTFAECWRLCREQYIEHSAKLQFAECLPKDTRQRFALPSACLQTLGKPAFAECHAGSTRHTASRVRRTHPPRPLPVTAVIVCRVPASGHSANTSLPSATKRALGKDYHVRRTRPLPRCHERYTFAKTVTVIVCRVPGWGTRQRFVNAECNYRGTRHSNSLPSVLFSSRRNNKKKFSNTVQTFFLATILYKTPHIRIWYIFCYVYYI